MTDAATIEQLEAFATRFETKAKFHPRNSEIGAYLRGKAASARQHAKRMRGEK